MRHVNRIELIGNVGRDIEIRTIQGAGDKLAQFTVATTDRWKAKDGQGAKVERTEWHRVVVFEKNAVAYVEKYLSKGALVRIVGRSQTRKWTDKDGVDRWTTEIVVQPFGGEVNILSSPDAARHDAERGAA